MKASERRLAKYFLRNGYVRVADDDLRIALGQRYKKGYEVRFILESVDEYDEVRTLLHDVGLNPGSPFRKGKRICQPVYGKEAQARILAWVDVVCGHR